MTGESARLIGERMVRALPGYSSGQCLRSHGSRGRHLPGPCFANRSRRRRQSYSRQTLSNLTLYVVDRHLQLQPVGVPGEICVSGVGVGTGYWRKEGENREASD